MIKTIKNVQFLGIEEKQNQFFLKEYNIIYEKVNSNLFIPRYNFSGLEKNLEDFFKRLALSAKDIKKKYNVQDLFLKINN